MNDAKRTQTINEIAKRILSIETLEEQNMDSLDFHEVSVWGIEQALQLAYEAGRTAATTEN